MLTGRCLCGAIEYEVLGVPYHQTNCHCMMCRRSAGAPVVTWFSVPRDTFRIISGTPTIYHSSAFARRSFCPTCGSNLTFESDRAPDEIDITTCTLDDPGAVPPQDQIHTSSRLPWMPEDAHLPAFLEERNDPQ
ncbi:MAG: GFA family protein [Acetobacteraceae bacterium]